MRTAVVTLVAGRHRHLRHHQAALADDGAPDLAVVVAMGDPAIRGLVDAGPLADRSEVLEVPVEGELPLARARNAGARAAAAAGAELLVFLDVDCLAGPGLVAGYRAAASGPGREGLLCGPVAYLPPLADGATQYPPEVLAAARPHPARPAPAPGVVQPMADLRLFWSLSFAVRVPVWERIGGFDEEYVGYGGEDTDFGQRAAAAGVDGWWVGGATACHQWHPVSDPPVEHLAAVVRNANLFADKWGWVPMEGWLGAFEERGLAERDGDRWRVVPSR